MYLRVLKCEIIFGLKNAASAIYVSEVSEESIRSALLSTAPIAINLGLIFALSIGLFLSWRQITLIVSIFPVVIIAAIYFASELIEMYCKICRFYFVSFYFIFRYQRHQVGSCQKIDQMMH